MNVYEITCEVKAASGAYVYYVAANSEEEALAKMEDDHLELESTIDGDDFFPPEITLHCDYEEWKALQETKTK